MTDAKTWLKEPSINYGELDEQSFQLAITKAAAFDTLSVINSTITACRKGEIVKALAILPVVGVAPFCSAIETIADRARGKKHGKDFDLEIVNGKLTLSKKQ